ncbi:hypothetical protein M409DRAFT_64497 [Zasmidium cellare ATCC 36951]|uniref:Protein artemis n=1 Tax=Zasmidium cellare ATCC 36951 TaxID=1080233 RepID=A0A6A6CS94_ZASCE|nr:uncharacterized protein M409DRAFT_64497 [Zasmidium cellare ATCC 36951]KAF2170147.1 hypothetical protein M409DRAFT_64497 [Zasmidium cellare ATCC 36951]
MSTFDGIVAEFPDIRIDHFRKTPSTKPAHAYFLSHVHSDHLIGLDSCKSPFIYCSPATREILLRLEKYPHRMNFSKGILERRVQTYKHLRKLLKPIPLETPTVLELVPGRKIRVTLFDANHCVGAVMFLIEDESKAVLYTGDIRSEAWWVDSLLRNPILLPYVASSDQPPLKQLDNVYLDTTFASKLDPYVQFPSTASGTMELLRHVSKYPPDTLFYVDAWTFGYEEVWQALSTFLQSQIHVDDYRYALYTSLLYNKESRAPEAFKLIGANCGNHFQKGCLSREQCRIHSCEKGTGCSIWNKRFVRITPIISRYNGQDMCEAGAGGGHGDLNQQNELEIDDLGMFADLMELCSAKLKCQPQLLASVRKMLTDAMGDARQKISLDGTEFGADQNGYSQQDQDDTDMDDIPLDKLVPALAKAAAKIKQSMAPAKRLSGTDPASELPSRITFPYSRHSSYSELCMLIEAFKPKDIYPCTVDHKGWNSKQSMEYLFGHIYGARPPTFSHDQLMLQHYNDRIDDVAHPKPDESRFDQDTQDYEEASPREEPPKSSRNPSTRPGSRRRTSEEENDEVTAKRRKVEAQGDFWPPLDIDHYSPPRNGSNSRRPSTAHSRRSADHASRPSTRQKDYEVLDEEELRLAIQQEAYNAALGKGLDWSEIGLVSVSGHQKIEEEL